VSEIILLLSFSFLMGVGCLAWAMRSVVSGEFASFDGLFLTLVCFLLAVIFSLNGVWTLQSQEFREWQKRRESRTRERSQPVAEEQVARVVSGRHIPNRNAGLTNQH
jgi:hypothetical protein